MDYRELIEKQKQFFASHKTKEINFRKQQLTQLRQALKKDESLLYDAIYKDFKKSSFDVYSTELSFLYAEIDYFIQHLPRLSKPQKVKTNLVNLWGVSQVHKEPLGVCLVIGAWNYPYQLTLLPVIAAMAAGNTCIIKPSEQVPHSSSAMATLIKENFAPEYLSVVETDAQQTSSLLENRFDKIFFTGSTRVGKLIYQAAAKHLTPVTLELGGKSPAIITEDADIKVAAKRIVWGKFLNAGQTCIAPDYICVHEKIKPQLIQQLTDYIHQFDYRKESEHFTQIVNEKHFDRIVHLIDKKKVICGGESDRSNRYISPTLMDHIAWDDKVMQEEIFGPILPLLSYSNFEKLIEDINQHEQPLSAYLFSNKKSEQEYFKMKLSFGGGCINDTLMHISNTHLPFGGVGHSGFGNYHGEYGFDTFSHSKAVLKRALWGEPNLKYPPYSESKFNWIKKLLK